MYVRMYVCMYVCKHMLRTASNEEFSNAYVLLQTYECTHTYIHIHTYIHTCKYQVTNDGLRMDQMMKIAEDFGNLAPVYVRMHVCMYLCMYVCT